MGDPLQLGLYVLLLLPGFIFVQIREYHLLREKRSQFEKTLEIILWSAAIWILACGSPVWVPFGEWRTSTLAEASIAVQSPDVGTSPVWSALLTRKAAGFYVTVCLWSALAANGWGIARKSPLVDAVIRWLTGRDWYPSVALRFFSENVNRTIIVRTRANRYMGILFGAPDTKEDRYVILTSAFLLPEAGSPEPEIEPLPLVSQLLIKWDDIDEIQALTPDILAREKG